MRMPSIRQWNLTLRNLEYSLKNGNVSLVQMYNMCRHKFIQIQSGNLELLFGPKNI